MCCTHCQSSNLARTLMQQGPHHARLDCLDCGKLVCWVAKPLDQKAVAAFVLPFGKHKGIRLDQVPRDYLHWLAANTDSASLRRKLNYFLESTSPQPQARRA